MSEYSDIAELHKQQNRIVFIMNMILAMQLKKDVRTEKPNYSTVVFRVDISRYKYILVSNISIFFMTWHNYI